MKTSIILWDRIALSDRFEQQSQRLRKLRLRGCWRRRRLAQPERSRQARFLDRAVVDLDASGERDPSNFSRLKSFEPL
jgi:hypothetical protein